MNQTIYISLTEDNAGLSAYPVTNGYLFYVVDQNSLLLTSNYYSNTAQCIPNFIDDDNFIADLNTLSGGTFDDYNEGYFNYTRTTLLTANDLYSEIDPIRFVLSGIQDTQYNIIKIIFDKFGDGTVITSVEKDFYLTYNDTSALQILDETNEYKSPKYKIFETLYQTSSASFTDTYTPKFYVYRVNGVVNVITINITVAKKSFLTITQNFRVIDIYNTSNNNIIIKMQNPVTNQIYFTTLSAG